MQGKICFYHKCGLTMLMLLYLDLKFLQNYCCWVQQNGQLKSQSVIDLHFKYWLMELEHEQEVSLADELILRKVVVESCDD